MSLFADCSAEIIRLHKILELWTRGTLNQTDQEFAQFADVLAPGLNLINPDGKLEARDKIVERFRASHGARAGLGFSIDISNIVLHYDLGDRALLSYQEHWLIQDKRDSTILSTALLGRQQGLPNNVAWLHLHETWI